MRPEKQTGERFQTRTRDGIFLFQENEKPIRFLILEKTSYLNIGWQARGLVENAALLDSEVHEHHSNNRKNDMLSFDHKLYALGRNSSGEIALYKITVEEYFQSKAQPAQKRFHNLRYIEKIADHIGGRTSEKSRSGGSTSDVSAIEYSISDLYGFVKRYDGEFTSNSVNTELLNAGHAKNGDGYHLYDITKK